MTFDDVNVEPDQSLDLVEDNEARVEYQTKYNFITIVWLLN